MTKPVSQALTLGRGQVRFDAFANGVLGAYTGRRYLGNTPELSLDITATQLDHYDSDQGLKIKDDSTILQLDRKGSFTTDKVSNDNMSLFLIGSALTQAQAAITSTTQTILAAKLDREYQVGQTAANPSGVRSLTTLTLATTAGTPVPLVINVDYTADMLRGTFYIIPTSTVVIDGVTGITVTYAASVAVARDQVQTAAIASVTGGLYFKAFNPKGDLIDYAMPYVLLTPNGSFALKGDNWQTVPFNFEVLQLNAATAHIYADGQPYTP